MEQSPVLAEYTDILDDCLDWLENGYRRERARPVQGRELSATGSFAEERTSGADGLARGEGPADLPSGGGAFAGVAAAGQEQAGGQPPQSAAGWQSAGQQAGGQPAQGAAEWQSAGQQAGGQPPQGAAEWQSAGQQAGGQPPQGAEEWQSASQQNTREQSALRTLADEIALCRQCNLYLLRDNTVPGAGLPGADLMIVTPPPSDGARNNPLPPYESEYLGKWLTALKLSPRDVFITPAVKCRTPGGRPPQQEEAEACARYLRRQYKIVAPKAILALGDAACGALTGNPADFPSLVAREWTYAGIPALVLWTPAEVLANPKRLRKPVWDSLQKLQAAWNALPGSSV